MPFGRTGHDSTRVLFGAAALGAMSQQRADDTLGLIARHGVNHIDTAAGYGDPELRLAPWLADHRDGVFLATKTGERTGPAARAELERSLTPLGTDHVELTQIHNLVEDDEWQTAFAPGGVVEAMAAARDEDLVRHIGVTGHGLRIAGMHQRSLEAFPFDSVLLPYSAVLLRGPGYRADVEALRSTCRERASPCRRSRPSPVAAGGTTTRAGGSPGTSPSATRPPSTGPCASCSPNRTCS